MVLISVDYLEKSGDVSVHVEKGDVCKGEESSREEAESGPLSDPHLPSNRPVQKNRKRCWICRSKLELVQQEVGKCKCGQCPLQCGVRVLCVCVRVCVRACV